MLETATAFVLAHVLSDFVFQSDRMVREKAKAPVLLIHIAIVAATSVVALGVAPVPAALGTVVISHLVIDWLKVRVGGPGFAAFALDQAAHLAVIAGVAAAWPNAFRAGLWGILSPERAGNFADQLPAAMALAAGLTAAIWGGGAAVKAIIAEIDLPTDSAASDSLPKGGRVIGRLERLMIFMLVLAGQVGAIGLLIAAKSVLRFNELARGQDRSVSEYVIIGTLASFAWALAVAFATQAAMAALAAP